MQGPLLGLRVLDCGRWWAAPASARILADLGASVIKIEQPNHPDPLRGLITPATITHAKEGKYTDAIVPNSVFEICNCGKRSFSLDVSKENGRRILYQLIEKVDVIVHNWSREQVNELELDFDTLTKYNHRLIYTVVSGWGPVGPEVDRPAMDMAGLARGGDDVPLGKS
ncbi:CoA transferase [Chloroflexota bacterium]